MAPGKVIRYAFFDGDSIGNAIDNLFRSGKIQEARHLSESIKHAIFEIEQLVNAVDNMELIIAGGDDILIKYDPEIYNLDFLTRLSGIFTKHTGLSMSFGDGENIDQAINNLMEAKQQNKGYIISPHSTSRSTNQSNKQTRIFILTTSQVPDPYINVIAHCAVYHGNIDQIVMIGISDDRGKAKEKEIELVLLKSRIENLLDKLSQGLYPRQAKQDDGTRVWVDEDIKMELVQRQRYSELKNRKIDLHVIVYEDLEVEIVKLINNRDSFTYIFDTTAFLKSYLVDVYTILRFRNISTIYSFELLSESRTYDYKELIHNLTYKKTYDYHCLSDSKYTCDKIVVDSSTIISEGKFNQLMSAFQSLEKSRDQLEDTISTDFARIVLFLYFLIGLLAFIPLYQLITQPDGWTRVEPYTFLIPLAWLLLDYLLQAVFTRQFPSLKPTELFQALKTWKKSRLERSRTLANTKKP